MKIKLKTLLEKIELKTGKKAILVEAFEWPTTFKIVKPIYYVGKRTSFGSNLGQTKNYTSYEWESEDNRDKVDYLNKGWEFILDPKSAGKNDAEYKLKGGNDNSIRGFTTEELTFFTKNKFIKFN